MKQTESYRVAVAGLDPRDLRLIEIVIGHSQYNRFRFVLLERFDVEATDLLIADTAHPEGRQALAALRAAGRDVPTIGAIARGASTEAKHAIAVDRLTLQLLPILNRVVETELSGREAAPTASDDVGVGLSSNGHGDAPSDLPAILAGPATRPLPRARPAATAAATSAAETSAARAATAATAPPGGSPRPAAAADDADRSPARKVIAFPGNAGPSGDGLRLRALIVDDSPTVRQQLQSAFDRFGMAAEAVASGEEALRRLSDGHVDLMMLDVGLPGIDGFTVLRALREEPRWRRLPVVVLSSRASPLDRARGLLAGADVYLAKPVQLADLHRIVLAQLRRSLEVEDLSRWFGPSGTDAGGRLASA